MAAFQRVRGQGCVRDRAIQVDRYMLCSYIHDYRSVPILQLPGLRQAFTHVHLSGATAQAN